MELKENERSFVIELISEINIITRQNDYIIKRAGGESSLKVKNQTLFPDILLFGDVERNSILHGWEAKMPDTPVTDIDLIDNAKVKAETLGANSFILWNFSAVRLYVKYNKESDYSILKSWDCCNIKQREDVAVYEKEWKAMLYDVLITINGFFMSGKLTYSRAEIILTNNLVVQLIQKNKPIVSNFLKTISVADLVMKNYIDNWWKSTKQEYLKDEILQYDAFAKVLLLHWFNRFIFAHLIKNNFNIAKEVEKIDNTFSPEMADSVFKHITSKCDFFNIFGELKYNLLIPKEAWNDLININMFLIENQINSIKQNTLKDLIENTVSINKREINGQFTTPDILAKILVNITTHNALTDIIDPCCGTGTIAKEAQILKKNLLDIDNAMSTTWLSDKDSFATQIAQLSLTDMDCMNLPVKIFQNNVFDISEDDEVKIINPQNGELLTYKIPQFETIISNLPFIAFETISVHENNKINDLLLSFKDKGITLSKRSDIYMPIIIKLWTLLKEEGFLGVIVSNSWLGTDAGNEFFSSMEKLYFIEQIHISGNKKWFNNADVIATILILKKKTNIETKSTPTFCLWKKSLSEIENNSDCYDSLVSSSLQGYSLDEDVIKMTKYTIEEIENYRKFGLSYNALFYNVNWLSHIIDKLYPKKFIFNIFRGERRGWDKMFYPDKNNNIEKEFLSPVLLRGKNINKLTCIADNDAFCCSDSIETLIRNKKSGALSWINKFEHEVNEKGIPLPIVLKNNTQDWYEFKANNFADFVTIMNPDRRLFYSMLDGPSIVNQRLIGLKMLEDINVNKDLCHALLNSILEMFFIESSGFGRGLGVLDINATKLKNSYMLNPNLLSEESKKEIVLAFKPLKNRVIENTEVELNKEDRIKFDKIVLKAYGIEQYYECIKETLISMQNNRIFKDK